MANKYEDVNAAWTEVDTATTALGTRVQTLITDLEAAKADDGITLEQTDAVIARLGSLRDQLNGMGSNPNQPIPEPTPDEPFPS